MKQYFLFLLGFSVSLVGFGQRKTDSIQDPVRQNFAQDLVQELSKFPLNYQFATIKDYTASVLYFKTESGDLKDGRTSETINNFGLKTQGVYRNKNGVLFFGDISISKEFYKNLKWNLSYDLPENGVMSDPHYFGVSKGGNWSNQEYDINGGFILPVSSKIKLLLNTNYTLFNKYRIGLDPRPEITYNNLDVNLGLSYKLAEKHHIKASFAYGYTHVDNEIKFSNNDKNLPANYDIYVRWMSGYGSLSSPFKNSTQRRITEYQAHLGYTFQTENLTIMADALYKAADQLTYRNNGVVNKDDTSNYFASYKPESFSVNVLGLYKITPLKQIKFNVSGDFSSGDNFWYAKGGKTYSAQENALKAGLSYLNFSSEKIFWDMGLSTKIWSVEQRDALATTSSNYTNLDFQPYIMRSFAVSDNMALSPFFKSTLRLNLDELYIQGNTSDLENIQENDFAAYAQRDFYSEVIIPNHELYSVNQLNLSGGTFININSQKHYNVSLKLQAGYQIAFQQMHAFSSSDPSRFSGLASLTISY
ncbi:hypothetical protein NO995_12320 [Aestuariibaculum sp. M13]|uniref:DUF6850 family outer membrane beta-barrel protein n=1 Tax=Aestuariibaculum sp. M13 TaxID=2967132 RepID=UPI002159EBAD|nr:DUF6850 family outer membrane beta-barrel protein [Aestuariibaculum sp. M13]MCR8668470.1 hypothetical protein [Aestuariibaculum sp. M13]